MPVTSNADINARNEEGQTAPHLAFSGLSEPFVTFALVHGADPTINDGRTFRDVLDATVAMLNSLPEILIEQCAPERARNVRYQLKVTVRTANLSLFARLKG